MLNFGDKLVAAIKAKGTPICVGLDPRLDAIPSFIKQEAFNEAEGNPMKAAALTLLKFNKGIIDAVKDIVPVVKPQIAFYENFGYEGVWAYQETLKYAKSQGLITIADAKRNDIGSTAEAYAQPFLGEVAVNLGGSEVIAPIFDADSITVNAYLGWDGVKPFVEEGRKYGKGLFVLVKTSNASSIDIQDLDTKEGKKIYEIMGHLVDSWGANDVGESGYNFVGAVVGATFPDQAKVLREIMPHSIFLVPGYGAQGGTAEDVRVCFDKNGQGAIVNNSRGIIFAYQKMEGMTEANYADAARKATLSMKDALGKVL